MRASMTLPGIETQGCAAQGLGLVIANIIVNIKTPCEKKVKKDLHIMVGFP